MKSHRLSAIFLALFAFAMVMHGRIYEERVYFTPADICANYGNLVSPLRDNLLKASIELRGTATAHRSEVEIFWQYDSVLQTSTHRACFTFIEASDDIYGNSKPNVEVTVDGAHCCTIDKGIASIGGFNTIALEFDFEKHSLSILAGSSQLSAATSIPLPEGTKSIAFGMQKPDKWEIDMVVEAFLPDESVALQTGYTPQSIQSILGTNSAAPAGYWRYLDRDCNPDYARLGGYYTLAIVPDSVPDRYLIIYLDGASTQADRWHTGMLKGILSATAFQNHYNLVWYDSTFAPHSAECSATLEQMSLLRLDFPLLKASIRLEALPSWDR